MLTKDLGSIFITKQLNLSKICYMSTSKVLSRSIKIKELYWKIKGANLTQF